jgi:O-antigen ligase
MPRYQLTPARRESAARILLWVFAFSAWSLTGLAHAALFLLVGLFLLDLPDNWKIVKVEPAFWVLSIGVGLTLLLAWRASLLFPDISSDQWHGVWVWCAPLLFIVVAWWLARDTEQVWRLMAAAILGLAVGVLRKMDWSLIPDVLTGLRYHFGYAALGLAFIASVMLIGLLAFRRRIIPLRAGTQSRPVLGWVLWVGAMLFVATLLVVTQSRGAALSLAIAGTVFVVASTFGRWKLGDAGLHRGSRRLTTRFFYISLVVGLASLFVWSTKDRVIADLDSFSDSDEIAIQDYAASLGARINLYRVASQVIATRPVLGWGPGTSTTEYVVPRDLVAIAPYDRDNIPKFSHLHSVVLEILVRFGLVGAGLAIALGTLLFRAFRHLLADGRATPDLRRFFALSGIVVLLFFLYDFRLINVDFRFFCILYFGILYAYSLDPSKKTAAAPARHHNA